VIGLEADRSKDNPRAVRLRLSGTYRGDRISGESLTIFLELEPITAGIVADIWPESRILRGGKPIPVSLRREIEAASLEVLRKLSPASPMI